MEKLKSLKLRLGIKSKSEDELLSELLKDAENFILAYTKRRPEQWLPIFDSAQVKIALCDYNRQGQEGMASRSEGEIKTDWGKDYPDEICKPLRPYRLILGPGGSS